MSLAIDVLEPSALLIVCQVLDGALLTRLRGVKPGIGGAANVRFCLRAAATTRGYVAITWPSRPRYGVKNTPYRRKTFFLLVRIHFLYFCHTLRSHFHVCVLSIEPLVTE